MNIDDIFSHPFHKKVPQISNQLSKWPICPITRFPLSRFIIDGDIFFKTLWQMIDTSKDYFWLTTYAINSSPAADTTLLKMIQACKRGVNVVLFVDNVQFWAKEELIRRFQNCGGRFLLLNPQWKIQSIKSYLNKDVWRRHHQKLVASDGRGIIGSSNIQGSYAGVRYGSSQYQDLNYYTENIAGDQYRQHFADTADMYGFNLHTRYQNDSLLTKLTKMYPNSQFYHKDKYRLLHNDPLNKRKQIQQSVIGMVQNAEQQIKIIQPYHYPMIKFDRAMAGAVRRGVKATILTSGQRDQPVFKNLFNYMLFQRLINNGIGVYQTKQRLLHSKVYIKDGKEFNMGSMNNDRWSWKINNQVNIVVKDQREAEWLEKYYAKMMGGSREVRKNYSLSASRAATIGFWTNFLYLMEVLMSKQGKPEEAYIQHNKQTEIIEKI